METKMATVYGIDRIMRIAPNNGTDFTVEELQGIVGGTFDIQHLPGTHEIMIVNDDGKVVGLETNLAATAVWRRAYPIEKYPHNNDQYIVGPVIVCDESMVR